MFHGIAKKAHYFFYTRLHLATCLPSKCDQADLDAIGQQSKYPRALRFSWLSLAFQMLPMLIIII